MIDEVKNVNTIKINAKQEIKKILMNLKPTTNNVRMLKIKQKDKGYFTATKIHTETLHTLKANNVRLQGIKSWQCLDNVLEIYYECVKHVLEMFYKCIMKVL